MASDECQFCAIVDGDAPASIVTECPETLAFMDLNPANEGHVLIVPKAHAIGLAALPKATGGRMFAVAQEIAGALRRSEFPTDGINLFLADGEAAGQEVAHVHLHVVPRTEDDEVAFVAHQRPADREHLDEVAESIGSLV